MKAVAVVVDEILTLKINSNLAFILNMTISILFLVQGPHFEKTLLKEWQRITLYMKAAAVQILEVLTRKLNPNSAFLLTLFISKAFEYQTPDFHKMLLN